MPHLHESKIKFLEDKKGQEFQDEIFRKMSADERMAFGSRLWRLAKALDSEKIDYGRNRPAASSQKSNRNP
ncbi:MAG: hypothetical protein UV75_C0009G0017 [Candidatus Giovannonibacteria bacterium GW2011_GWA1_43_15]|nr:MAG: hypothetical protein UV72_C0014G0025 [Candidatus Giovannonibacteria bacterium GW2011_GWB1_43_13]KKS99133.1 MAG: hypothetical protein UV75_C0009G0017 [Candidatus Giovannonibacteria bacterium GW2011_GWA1_43_15]